MYFTTITVTLALLGSNVVALPEPGSDAGRALGMAIPTNEGPICQGNSGLNIFDGTKGTGSCQDHFIPNDGTCMQFDPLFHVRSVHLADGAGWSVPHVSALRQSLTVISSALYSSQTCDIKSENDQAAALLQNNDDLYADQPNFKALTFQPRGWQCSYWPPKVSSVPVARSVDDTTNTQELAPGTLMLCDKASGLGRCGIWSFKNNRCVSIGDDFTIASIYIETTTHW